MKPSPDGPRTAAAMDVAEFKSRVEAADTSQMTPTSASPELPWRGSPMPGSQLSAAELAQLAEARQLSRKIRRAMTFSTIDGWSIAIFGGLTLLFGLFSISGLLLGIAMGIIAFFEFRGGAALRRLEPDSPRILGYNQLAFGAILIGYAAWNLYLAWSSPLSAALGVSDPQVETMLAPFESMAQHAMVAVYVTLIFVGVLAQGGAALFYFRCQRHIETYLSQTPEWIVRLQRAGVRI